MLIDFRELFPRYNIKPKGVLHVGANVGEEAPVYNELGIKDVVWIEGNPELMPKLRLNLAPYTKQLAYNFCIGDNDGERTSLHISNNASQSSSILELGTHKTAPPEVHFTHDIDVTIRRIDNLFYDGELPTANMHNLDFLNIDLQGAELKALKGMGELIQQFKWAYLEVNKEELYKGCALVEDIDFYLGAYGFTRVETKWCGNTGWGDAIFIKDYVG